VLTPEGQIVSLARKIKVKRLQQQQIILDIPIIPKPKIIIARTIT
jgi:hypothetical protein